ncbi:hypothetical protein ONZ45_g8130 [Pleurotus djamor]|nr:hypothetical protein ONZ45_g8130 [Pleurotus djamor]
MPLISPNPAQGLIDKEILALKEAIRSLKTARNTHSYISQIPDELLSVIFIQGKMSASKKHTGTCSWLNIASVCRHWRQVSVDTPQLWSSIHIRNATIDRAEEMLKRSKASPLDLKISLKLSDDPRVFKLAKLSLSDIGTLRELRVTSDDFTLYRELLNCSVDRSAPILRRLRLLHQTPTPSASVQSDEFMFSDMPVLTCLELRHFPIPASIPLFNNLTRLRINNSRGSGLITIQLALRILKQTPQAEEVLLVKLKHHHQQDEAEFYPVRLPRLKSLKVYMEAIDASIIFDYLDIPKSTFISTDCSEVTSESDPVDISYIHQAWSRFSARDTPLTEGRIMPTRIQHFRIHLFTETSEDPVLSLCHHIPVEPFIPLFEIHLFQVTTLTLDSLGEYRGWIDLLPSFDKVEYLTLVNCHMDFVDVIGTRQHLPADASDPESVDSDKEDENTETSRFNLPALNTLVLEDYTFHENDYGENHSDDYRKLYRVLKKRKVGSVSIESSRVTRVVMGYFAADPDFDLTNLETSDTSLSPMALSLPEDILIIIIELSDKSTLRSLLFVSKQIHHFAEPIFLKAVSLDVSGRPSTLSLFRTFIRSTSLSLGSLKNQGHSQLQARRPRSLCVKSFSVKFVALHDREDIEVLDKLLPTLINLESLSFNFHFYNTEIGRFAFLQDAPVDASLSNYSSPMSLREFSFTSSGHQGTLDIAPFLRSRPNLERIQLYSTLLFVPPQQKLSFPNLKVYGGYVPLQTLLRSTETLTHARALLQTEGLPEMPALLTWSVDSLQDLTFTTLNFILLRARNVKYLEIFDFDFGWDYWEDLGDALCDSNVEHIRIVIDSDSSWNTTRVYMSIERPTQRKLASWKRRTSCVYFSSPIPLEETPCPLIKKVMIKILVRRLPSSSSCVSLGLFAHAIMTGALSSRIPAGTDLPKKLNLLCESIKASFQSFSQLVSQSAQVANERSQATAKMLCAVSDAYQADELPFHNFDFKVSQSQAVTIHKGFRELRFSLHVLIRTESSEPSDTNPASGNLYIHRSALNILLKLLDSAIRFSDWWKHRTLDEGRLRSLIQSDDIAARGVCTSLKDEFETYAHQVQLVHSLAKSQLVPIKSILHQATEIPGAYMDVAVQAMSEITSATHKTFERLSKFHQHFSLLKQKDKSKDMCLAHERIVTHSQDYAKAISTSVDAAEQGFLVARSAIAILEEDLEANRTALIATMSIDVSVAHRKASETEEAFRNIRQSLFTVQSSIGGSYHPSLELGVSQGIKVSDTELTSTPSSDLLQATLQVLDELVEAIGRFVDLWAFIAIENSRLSRIIGVGSHASKGLWQSLEKQYSAYFTEQDYYVSVTKGLKKNSKGRTWFKGFNLITLFKSSKQPGRRGKSQHGDTG